jgi:hypothetical protein
MKSQKFIVVLLALSLMGINAAWAHGWRGGVYIGGPMWYPAPYYYPPQVVVVPQAPPPVYIEQQDAAAPVGGAQQYWYYCTSAKGYYPYVKDCPAGWQKILPQPEK